MPSLLQRRHEFVGSPQGKRLVKQGQQQPTKPENKQKVKQVYDKLRTGRTPSR